nr:MAG TPA: hypothetical protein [Caudoviricetes sp.]
MLFNCLTIFKAVGMIHSSLNNKRRNQNGLQQ